MIKLYLNFLSISHLDALYWLKILLLLIYISCVFIFWIMFFKDISSKLQNDFINFPKERFNNMENGQFINLSLMYKITSFKITIIKICAYFFITFFLIFSLRFSRLGAELNLSHIFVKLLQFPFCVKLLGIYLCCLYLYLFKAIWSLWSNQLYLELKKIHIYLQQFNPIDGIFRQLNMEKNIYANFHYYYFLFIKNIRAFNSFIQKFYIFYEDKKYTDNDIVKHFLTYESVAQYLKTAKYIKISYFLMPIYYFCTFSRYREALLVKIIKFLFKQIHMGFWTIVKILPILAIFITVLIEYKHNNYVIRYAYYIIFIMFIYKILIDLFYFIKTSESQRLYFICICYYNIPIVVTAINQRTPENRAIYYCYLAYTNFNEEKPIQLYLFAGLNHNYFSKISDGPDFSSKNETFIGNVLKKIKNTKISSKFRTIIKKIDELLYPPFRE